MEINKLMYHLVKKVDFLSSINDLFLVGFEHNSEALAAAEIEQKMAEFELEPIMDNTTNDQQDVDNDQ